MKKSNPLNDEIEIPTRYIVGIILIIGVSILICFLMYDAGFQSAERQDRLNCTRELYKSTYTPLDPLVITYKEVIYLEDQEFTSFLQEEYALNVTKIIHKYRKHQEHQKALNSCNACATYHQEVGE